MKIWHQYPFIRLIIPFILGIYIAIYVDQSIHIPLVVLMGIFLSYFFVIFLIKKKIHYRYRWVPGVLIYLFLLLVGYELTILRNPKFDSSNILHIADKSNFFLIRVTEPISERQHSFKIVAKSIGFKDSLQWKNCSGKLLLYFEKDSTVKSIEYGDQLIIYSKVDEVNSPMNPSEFNYKRYLSNHGIYNQGFVKAGNWKILARHKGNPLKSTGLTLRTTFLDILESNQIKGREFGVASAILLGLDDYLEADQQKEFAGAGAMHILCVSGLHVGIIYVILSSLLLFLDKRKGGRILKVILLLILIWFYALITGFSPSVLRASTMFSFVILGGLIKRRVNVYNSLAASAFFLLIIDPFMITEVGFQLSYMAVFGIVWLYRPVYQLFIPNNWLLNKIWQISVVSIAATLATFPLSIYYFHQFPNLFLITNLVAIPSAMFIIYIGILVLLTSFIPFISFVFAKLLVSLLWILNTSVKFIEGLPFSTIRGIYINELELLFIILLIVSLCYFLFDRKKNYLFASLGLGIILMISINTRTYKNLHQQKIIVYHVNKFTAIEFSENKTCTMLIDSVLQKEPSKIDYHIRNNWVKNGTNSNHNVHLLMANIEQGNLYKRDNYIQFFDKTMVLVNPELILIPTNKKMHINYLVISQNPDIKIVDLQECFDFEKVIIDSSNPYWKIQKWIESCKSVAIDYYLVKDKGAWEYRI